MESGEAKAPTGPLPPAFTPKKASSQIILCERIKLFDPDRLLIALEPHLRFLWTKAFVVVILLANFRDAVVFRPDAIRWETLVHGFLTLVVITTCHEFAHGLSCQHFGGEVHEFGFLLA